MEKAVVGVERNKGKGVLDRRPAQLARASDAAADSRQEEQHQSKLARGCASSSSDIETLLLL